MFGNIGSAGKYIQPPEDVLYTILELTSNAVSQAKKYIDPKDIPPPTPINLPRYQPFAQDNALTEPSRSIGELLKQTGRVSQVLGPVGLSALGLDLKLDVPLSQLIPDTSYIPDFGRWESLSVDEAREQNNDSRRVIINGGKSPGCQVYLERSRELTHSNEDAFRTVRRILPPKGQQQARLGNAYEFFRSLELMTSFWDDPTAPTPLPPSPELMPQETTEQATGAQNNTGDFPLQPSRIAAGTDMPHEYRNNLMNALIKLVAYDFGCNTSPARQEPRLQMRSPKKHAKVRKSYTPSMCTFIYQSPKTREEARAGVVVGPIAAVSTRNTTSFDNPSLEEAQSLDLAREVVAALITAQQRTREGKTEHRFGEGEWWTTRPRWGGGSGGPIGREIDQNATPGEDIASEETGKSDGLTTLTPMAKRPRKGMSIYDNYRMVRLPSATWDARAKYQTIGKQYGTNHDEIFVLSCIFHHVSVLRVRVPQRLLEVLDGAPEPDASRRSWGNVSAWRSPWYDLFDVGQRVAAMQTIWCVMAYQMRKDTGAGGPVGRNT